MFDDLLVFLSAPSSSASHILHLEPRFLRRLRAHITRSLSKVRKELGATEQRLKIQPIRSQVCKCKVLTGGWWAGGAAVQKQRQRLQIRRAF